MKNNIFLLIVLFFVCSIVNAQTTFQKTCGGTANDLAFCVAQTFDGGYILAGQTVSFGQSSQYYIYLVKMDANGDTVWTKSIGDSNHSVDVYSVQQTTDSGYIVCGMRNIFGPGSKDIFIIKTNSSGNIQWTKAFGGTNLETGFAAQQTSDGGYIVAGGIEDISNASDICLIKTDGSGNIAWTKILSTGINAYDNACSVQQTDDGGYILTGYNVVPLVAGGMFLVKTDSVGNIVWAKSYGGTNIGFSVQQTTDGGYIILGNIYTTDYDICLIKTDATGDTLWTRAYGGPDVEGARSVRQTGDGGYIIAGETRSFTVGLTDGYLIKTDSTGNISWSRSYGGSSYDMLYSAQQTSDGGYIAVGQTLSFGAGMTDIYLIKTDPLGNSGCHEMNAPTVEVVRPIQVVTQTYQLTSGITVVSPAVQTSSGGNVQTLCLTTGIYEKTEISGVVLFPNPATDHFTIDLGSTNKEVKVDITDITGKIVYKTIAAETQQIEVNTKDFAKGIYLVQMQTGKFLKAEKLVVIK